MVPAQVVVSDFVAVTTLQVTCNQGQVLAAGSGVEAAVSAAVVALAGALASAAVADASGDIPGFRSRGILPQQYPSRPRRRSRR